VLAHKNANEPASYATVTVAELWKRVVASCTANEIEFSGKLQVVACVTTVVIPILAV
jgi:hypothetical protein